MVASCPVFTCKCAKLETSKDWYDPNQFEYMVSPQNNYMHHEAKENCQKWGGNLASIHSRQENDRITSLIR